MSLIEIPVAIGNYLSQWAECALDYFEKTDFIVALLLTIFSPPTFQQNDVEIKRWLRLGLPKQDQDILENTDLVIKSLRKLTEEENAMRSNVLKKLNRLFARLSAEMFPIETARKNPFLSQKKLENGPVIQVNNDTPKKIENVPVLQDNYETPISKKEIKVENDDLVEKMLILPMQKLAIEETPAEELVCFVCLQSDFKQDRLECGHTLHLKCKRKIISHKIYNCFCRKVFHVPTINQLRTQKVKENQRLVANIIDLLHRRSYSNEELAEIYDDLNF